MSNEAKVVNGVRSTIAISNTDLVTTMVVKLMRKLKTDLELAQERKKQLEDSILSAPLQKAIDLAKIINDTDANLIAWKSLLKSLNPKTDFEIKLKENLIENYVIRAIEALRQDVGEVEIEIISLSFDFGVKNDRRSTPYFYNVKIGDLRPNEFPIDINFKMEIDKTELNKVQKEISDLENKIRNKQAIQDEATAKITEASIMNNPELSFLANISIETQNLLGN